jgi:hypothetical protein
MARSVFNIVKFRSFLFFLLFLILNGQVPEGKFLYKTVTIFFGIYDYPSGIF